MWHYVGIDIYLCPLIFASYPCVFMTWTTLLSSGLVLWRPPVPTKIKLNEGVTVNVFVTVYLPLFPSRRYDSPIRFAYYLYYDLPPSCPVTTLCVQVEHTVNGFWMIHDHLIDDQRSWSFVNLLWLLIVSTKRPLTSSTALRCRLCDRWHHRENNNCVDETLLLSVVVINSTGISVVVPCWAEYSSGPWIIA